MNPEDLTDAAWKRGVVFGLQRAAAHILAKAETGSIDTVYMLRKLAKELELLAKLNISCDKKD